MRAPRESAKQMSALKDRVRPLSPSAIALAYWCTDESVKSLAARYRSSAGAIRKLAGPAEITGLTCPICERSMLVSGRDHALRVFDAPFHAADAEQGVIPSCMRPDCRADSDLGSTTWYWRGDIWLGTPGGGVYGDRWRAQDSKRRRAT